MKYRIRIDLSFNDEEDALNLMNHAKGFIGRAVSLNEGKDNQEISFCELELCRHEEGLPCSRLDRVEVHGLEV